MSIIKDENSILNFIKFAPIIFVLLTSAIYTSLFIIERKNILAKEIANEETKYIEENKNRIKPLVTRIYNLFTIEKEVTIKNTKASLKNEVTRIHKIAQEIYNKDIKNKNYSKEKTIQKIETAIKNIQFFDNKGYIYLFDSDGTNIISSEYPDNEGKNFWNVKDGKGSLILQDVDKLLKMKNEFFYTWFWKRNKEQNITYEKVGFIKKFEPYNLLIVMSFYVDDFESVIKKNVTDRFNLLKFNKFDHTAIYTKDGLYLVHPNKNLVGKKIADIKDNHEKNSFQNELKFLKTNKEGFIADESKNIISYIKSLDEWGWVIKSGFHLEKLYTTIELKKQKLIESNDKINNNIIKISLLITIILIIASFYVTTLLKKSFTKYKLKIKKETDEKREKEKLLIQQSKMADLGMMIGAIAHQWRQPLTSIAIFMENLMLFKEMGKMDDKVFKENVTYVIDNAHYLADTIDTFQNFYKPVADAQSFHLKKALDNTYIIVEPYFKNMNITIDIKENLKNDLCLTHKNELQQIITSLMLNARDALGEKQEIKNKQITVKMQEDKEYFYINITDNGPGIKDEFKDKLFQSFETTKGKNGTGSGLYLSRLIARKKLQGDLTVSSYKNPTTFLLKLKKNIEKKND